MRYFTLLFLLTLCFFNTNPVWCQEETGQNEQDDEAKVEQAIEAMMLTSKAFRSATESVKPWLVTIESFGGVSAVAGQIGGIRKQGEGNATGILISSDGYLLTSTFSFVEQPPIITVITGDGKRHVAKLLGRDNTRKLALLKIEDVEGLPTPEFVDPTTLDVGQWAISVGVGYGDSNPAISMGIISATNRISGRAIQTDANVSPANYGGPLIDIEGRCLGICVPMNPQSQAIGAGVEWYDSGIGFAIPLHGLDGIIERLKKGEEISPAFLGVQAGPSDDGKGLEVAQVIEDSAAKKMGIAEGDVILLINGKKAKDVTELRKILSRFEEGDEVEVTFLAGEEKAETTKTAKLGSPPKPKTEGPQVEPPKIR